MGLFVYQPFKTFYALIALGVELARLPFWIIKFALPSLRQHRQWSLRQALGVKLARLFIYHSCAVRINTPLPLTPGKEKEQFVTIEPGNTELYKGPLISNSDVKPAKIGATWYPAPLTGTSATDNVTVVLHLHGGAFVIGDGRLESFAYAASKLLKHAGVTHVLAPQYRLSTLPISKTSNAFPAGLIDALTSYLYLIKTLKISPKNVVISGDSAGGNLATALLRYLSEYGADLDIPNPSAAWLWSPWVNPATDDEYTRDNKNYPTDYITFPLTSWGAIAYKGHADSILKSPYVASKGHPFKTDVPIWINAGDAEVLYFDDVQLAEELKEKGNDVKLDIQADVPHDILLMGNLLGFDDEVTAMAKRAGEWLKEVRKV